MHSHVYRGLEVLDFSRSALFTIPLPRTRNSPTVLFFDDVPHDDREDIETQIRTHHSKLPAGHAAKGAPDATVKNGWTNTSSWDGYVKFFYHSGVPNGRSTKIGGTQTVCRPLKVMLGVNVPEWDGAGIVTRVRAHHAHLAVDDEAKYAKAARVIGEGWHTSEDDSRVHLRVQYHSGYPRGGNQIGVARHVY